MTETKRVSATVEIINKRGLHARASARFVACVARYESEVTVRRDDTTVSGRSIMGLMMLGAGAGATIEIAAQGSDADAVLAELTAMVADKFHEDE